MLAFKKLAGNARRFKMLMGMSLQEFEFLLAKIERVYPEEERKRLSKRPRQRGIGAGRRFSLDLRNRVLLLLFYYRTYATQDVAAEVFGVGQAAVSRSIEQIAPIVRQCVPIPAKIHAKAKKASTMEELEEIFPGLICLMDASEQQIRRPKRKDMERSHYSGKAGRHTAKTQYAVNVPWGDNSQLSTLPGTRARHQGVQDKAPDIPQEPAAPKRIGQGRRAYRLVVLCR